MANEAPSDSSLHGEKSIDKDHAVVFQFEAVSGYPTEDERVNLRRVPGKVPWAAFLIAGLELRERFSYC